MLRYVAVAFLFTGLIGLVGCDSGGGSSFPDSGIQNGVSTPVQITLTQTQNIRAVSIQHEFGNSGNFEQVYSQDFSVSAPPDPIDFTVNLISGDHYRVDATTFGSNGNQQVTSQDFVAGASSDSFNASGFSSRAVSRTTQHLLFKLSEMHPLVNTAVH